MSLHPPTIRSPISSTQIPTLNSNHTHPHPHPPRQPADSPRRSISYTATPTTHPATPVASTSTSTATTTAAPKPKEKHDDLTCDHKVKGALTELLNDGSVKADIRGRRSVQKFLMETERELRTQRRKSLGGRRSRRGSVGVVDLKGENAKSEEVGKGEDGKNGYDREDAGKVEMG